MSNILIYTNNIKKINNFTIRTQFRNRILEYHNIVLNKSVYYKPIFSGIEALVEVTFIVIIKHDNI